MCHLTLMVAPCQNCGVTLSAPVVLPETWVQCQRRQDLHGLICTTFQGRLVLNPRATICHTCYYLWRGPPRAKGPDAPPPPPPPFVGPFAGPPPAQQRPEGGAVSSPLTPWTDTTTSSSKASTPASEEAGPRRQPREVRGGWTLAEPASPESFHLDNMSEGGEMGLMP